MDSHIHKHYKPTWSQVAINHKKKKSGHWIMQTECDL